MVLEDLVVYTCWLPGWSEVDGEIGAWLDCRNVAFRHLDIPTI